MASIVSAGTTSATALNMSADTTGVLQLASNNGTVGLTLGTSQQATFVGRVYLGSVSAALANENILTGGQSGGIQLVRNSSGNPTSGQSLGTYAWKGTDSANTNAAAEAMIEAVAAENQSGSTAATDLLFYTKPTGTGPGSSPTERLRIDSAGLLFLALTSSAGYTSNATPKAYINAGSSTAAVLCGLTLINQGNGGTSGYGVSLRFNMSTSEPGKYCQIAATADGSFANSIGLAFYTTANAAAGADNVTQRMYISGGGSIGAPSGTNIYNASDERLKKNIQPLTGNLAKINSLEPVSFNWIENFCKEENDKVLYGFVAQRTQTVDDNLVEHFGASSNVTIDAGTDNEVVVDSPLRVNEKFIIPMLVGAVKELTAELQALKAKVGA